MAQPKPIVLLTDFGYQDSFVGIMKGVIMKISSESRVIDLTHGIQAQDILQAAFSLQNGYSYFPEKSVFCVVVDPGVGSNRKPICIETDHYFFVGPDNGVLWPAACSDNIRRIFHLNNPQFFLQPVSHTFHGRDIFAPVSAHISKGIDELTLLGDTLNSCVEFDFPKIRKTDTCLELSVINIDRFGNIILNITQDEFQAFIRDRSFVLHLGTQAIKTVYQTYSRAKTQDPFLIPSSSGYMEISIKNGDAAGVLSIFCLDKACLNLQNNSLDS